MRSGTPSNDSIEQVAEVESESSPNPIEGLLHNKAVFAVVSIACFTAAVAAGTYAVWLSRHKVAQEALSNVKDLLSSCQSRMSQMETDLKSLSGTPSNA